MWPFSLKKEKIQVGIDIGTTSIKVVKIKKTKADSFKKDAAEKTDKTSGILIDYGVLETSGYLEEKTLNVVNKDGISMVDPDGVNVLRSLLEKLGIQREDVIMSIPVFSSFVDEIILPPLPEEEIKDAVAFEARSRVPVPITEVEIAWQIVENEGKEKRIMIAAVPKEVIFRYRTMCDELRLNLVALEVETFSVIRALNLYEKEPVLLIDIGSRNTSASLVASGFLRASHTIEISGKDITNAIARGMGVSVSRAEQLKENQGLLLASDNPLMGDLLYPLVDRIIEEARRILEIKGIKEDASHLILTGGSAMLKGLQEYFQKKFPFSIDIADPWVTISYDSRLQSILSQNASSFTTAIGLALY